MKNSKSKSETKKSKKLALHFMKTLVDVARESFLILDSDLRVISGNPTFYQTFRVSAEKTEGFFIYELGNGQWDIPQLRSLLEKILPEKKTVKDYEVRHVFEKIGEKTMLLNAKQIDAVQLIILAIEDITVRKNLEKEMSGYTKKLEAKVKSRTKDLAENLRQVESLNKTMVGREIKMMELKKEIRNLKKRVKNGRSVGRTGNGKNGNGKNGRSVGRTGNGKNGNGKNGRSVGKAGKGNHKIAR